MKSAEVKGISDYMTYTFTFTFDTLSNGLIFSHLGAA